MTFCNYTSAVQPDKDMHAQQSSPSVVKSKKTGTLCLNWTSISVSPLLPTPVLFSLRPTEALPGSCGQKSNSSTLLPEVHKSRCHSCPTLHLVWETQHCQSKRHNPEHHASPRTARKSPCASLICFFLDGRLFTNTCLECAFFFLNSCGKQGITYETVLHHFAALWNG